MLEIGSVIDDTYKILNVVGKGGMSVVYLARNERANKQWAIKEIFKHDYKEFELDKKEIYMMKKLKHKNLPSIVDVIEGNGSLLIVMDYIEGCSLDQILKEQGAQPEVLVIEWAKQLCDVLIYLHSREPAIIYRDMKPANVMLKPDGTIILIDFGAAREYKPENANDTISLGTRGYAAPEQYEGFGQSDARTDIYCLGVMLFQLLTGESPHKLQAIRNINAGLSSGLEAIIEKCTRVKKEERYQSCTELLYALENYWKLDADYRKKQKKKLISFLIPAMLTCCFGMIAGIFGILKYQALKSNYDAYLLAAQNSITKEDEIENYKKAIDLNPLRSEAYLALLKNAFLDDGMMTTQESEQLRAILINYGNEKQTNEVVFRGNKKGYATFAYEAGIIYFYKFEEKENKKNAKGYLEIAANSKYLGEKQVERAKRLYQIADYYSSIGILDEAGDATITYLDYWKDLISLADGNLVEADNERTALVMYEEIVSQMFSKTVEFKNAGVEQEEMLTQLENIETHLKTDFLDLNENSKKVIEEEILVLKKNISSVKKIILSTYQEEQGDENDG